MKELSPEDPLWKLLGQAREPEGSPYFAAKVMRRIEEADAHPAGIQALLRSWLPLSALSALAILFVFASVGTRPPNGGIAAAAPVEFDTIKNLDLFVSNQESSIWLQN